MPKNKIIPIDYTSRDFNSIRNDLITYVKRYYPDTYKDFNEASFGSLMLDTVAYVGDMLSFYLDYQANESFMDTSVEYSNIVKHAKQMGYKFSGTPLTYGECTFYVLVPVEEGTVLPDMRYAPTLLRGSRVTTPGGSSFSLSENVNFANPANSIVVAKRSEATQAPTYFAIKATGTIVSGEIMEETYAVGDFERFLKVELPGEDIGEVVSVVDSVGNEYYEVDYLSQDVIYRELKSGDNSSNGAASVLKAFPATRRFVVEKERDSTFLQFGYGSESELTNKSVVDPSEIALKVHGKNYVTNTTFDPKNLTSTDKFGIAPGNTTLYIQYRKNSDANSNAASGAITKVAESFLKFDDESVLNSEVVSFISRNIECINEDPIVGHVTMPTVAEIKRRAINTFATQARAVTKQDYVSSVYSMPSRFGAIKRCMVMRDKDELKRNLNIYLISEGASGDLVKTNSVIKENVKTWLNEVRMIGDTIDLLDAHIVNIGIEFDAIAEDGANTQSVLANAIDTLVDGLGSTVNDIGESFYVTDVFKLLKDVDGLLDVEDVRIVLKTGGGYSESSISIDENMSPDGRVMYVPYDHIVEIKLPYTDIVGNIR
jgi:hypothetical protein